MAKRNNVVPLAAVKPVQFGQALSERYLSYALSTIMARSLPDVRDGLKPVHRRLLYAMRQLRLDPNSAFKKSARVVGDVIGQYHPHGDQSIYDALVRLAQEFAARYPLIEGQGNFGNIDGDNPAAMRYTEARLTEVAEALLAGIDENAVDFRPNYDGSTEEPVVLPGGFPNLLANGAAGIAVGMACSIPPHNAGELCDALLHLIRTPNARIDTLVDLVKGPDFPTGGVLVEPRESIARGLQDRPRRLPAARALPGRGAAARPVPHHRHRDPLPGPEGQADRAHRRDHQRQEAADPRGRARRIGRRRAHRARAAHRQRRRPSS